MPRQNRVTPYGELAAVADRGMFWGNRGELTWTHGGYRERRPRPDGARVSVLTPRATVAVLGAGYQPVLHPMAAGRHSREAP
jgi:hypothetical protein